MKFAIRSLCSEPQSIGFPYFLQFKSEFGNKEFMIWATVSSWPCFCWLYWVSPSLAAKNIINLISVLTIWWCSCVVSSPVLLDEGVCYDQFILLAKLLAFDLVCFVLQGQICLLLQCLLTSFFCVPDPYNEKDIFFGEMILITASYTMLRTSVHSSSGSLSIRSNPLNLFVTSTV